MMPSVSHASGCTGGDRGTLGGSCLLFGKAVNLIFTPVYISQRSSIPVIMCAVF
uniref:Uncharacterized protein n=1 Tax=Anguilla anguilla TaxID=7936 RepID=A0A0E9WGY6_ANGAN